MGAETVTTRQIRKLARREGYAVVSLKIRKRMFHAELLCPCGLVERAVIRKAFPEARFVHSLKAHLIAP